MRRVFAIALLAASFACGTEAPPEATDTSPKGAFPAVVHSAAGELEIATRPSRIVSLSATGTEILFAIGAGDQVIAVSDQSDYPPGVPTTSLSGYKPNVEAIAKYKPDLVIATDDTIQRALTGLDIPLLIQPAPKSLTQAYDQFQQLGQATGHVPEASQQVRTIKSRLREIVATLPKFVNPPTYYHELDNTYFTATSETFIGQVYKLAGLTNIADKADKAGTGYPQLSAEYIIQADPDLVFLADSECCQQTPARVAERPGWNKLSAVRNGAVVDVGDDIASRWGPRIVDFLEKVADALARLDLARR